MLFDIDLDTEEEVLAIRSAAKAALADGAEFVSNWSSQGTTVTKVREIPARELIEECNLFLRAKAYGSAPRRLSVRYI